MKQSPICKVNCIHDKAVRQAQAKLLSDESLLAASDIFRNLADFTRIKILHALSIRELCVCDIAFLLKTSQPAISHQLRVLRAAGFVKYRKEGKMAFYSLADRHVLDLIKTGMSHAKE